MPFVKLDTGILDSTLWVDCEARDVFITALLLADLHEVTEPLAQLDVRNLKETGFIVPPGWYGFVRAAGAGIVRRAILEATNGLDALDRLGEPDPESRSSQFEGRRLVRVDGGYIILNYTRYRERDYTSAERQKRYRDRQRKAPGTKSEIPASRNVTVSNAVTLRDITHADADVDVDVEKRKNRRSTSRKKPETAIPDNFSVSARVLAWATEKGHGRLDERLEHFTGYAKSKGKTYIDWDEAFMRAVREDWARLATTRAPASSPQGSFLNADEVH